MEKTMKKGTNSITPVLLLYQTPTQAKIALKNLFFIKKNIDRRTKNAQITSIKHNMEVTFSIGVDAANISAHFAVKSEFVRI
tara:strand:- start:97 stop:342 length:246 start_codon:yes stop_codon:yes gene_type:complete